VLLHGSRRQAGARVAHGPIACNGDHLRAVDSFRAVHLVDAALLALGNGRSQDILLVGEDVGIMRRNLLQRASCPPSFRRYGILGLLWRRVDGSRFQVAQRAARGCLGGAVVSRRVRPVGGRGAHLCDAMCRISRRVETGRIVRSNCVDAAGCRGTGMGVKNASRTFLRLRVDTLGGIGLWCCCSVAFRWKSHHGRYDHRGARDWWGRHIRVSLGALGPPLSD
jgi:hypothetical protein